MTGAHRAESEFAADVRRGLTNSKKQLPPKYFYDELGSTLFAAICALPEYYVWRAEDQIFRTHGAEIAGAFGSPVRLIELGSGNAGKTRALLDAVLKTQPALDYVAVDIDSSVLQALEIDLASTLPGVRVIPVAADFHDIDRTLHAFVPRDEVRNVVLFIGSTIGNLTPAERDDLLSAIRRLLATGDAMFLGTDLIKSKDILEPAYDDPTGVTAAFNLNVLGRINRELGGTFDLRAFRHHAFYNEEKSRIEMHLVSSVAQDIRIDAVELTVGFAAGETIHTENSYKFEDAAVAALAARNGFRVERRWTDERAWFADTLLVAI